MKKIKIWCILLVLCLLLTVLLTACNEASEQQQQYFSLDELQGKTFSLWLGCGYEAYLKAAYPDAQMVFGSYVPDLALSVRQGKADAMVVGDSFFHYYSEELTDMVQLEGDLGTIQGSLIFSDTPRGNALREEYNTWLASAYADGTMQELHEKWLTTDHSRQTIDQTGLDESWEHIPVGVAEDEPPYAFLKGDQLVGHDTELIVRFCKACHYYPEFSTAQYEALITGVQAERYDIVGSGFEITEDRINQVRFADPSWEVRIIVAVKGAGAERNFFASVRKSFTRTFLEDDRYKMFLNGMGVTAFMTLCSVFFGMILSLAFYFFRRDMGKPAQRLLGVCSTLVHRIPTIVLLMLLYYVVFGKSKLSAALVCTLFFIFSFGVSMFEGLELAVGAVGKEQREAAFTLGLTKNETLFKILLPQGRTIFFASFQDNVINTLLDSAVAGYVTVVDLTRAGDIIRNNTYEAFFPLIAVALFYLLISSLIVAGLKLLEKKTDPTRRSRVKIFRSAAGLVYTENK